MSDAAGDGLAGSEFLDRLVEIERGLSEGALRLSLASLETVAQEAAWRRDAVALEEVVQLADYGVGRSAGRSRLRTRFEHVRSEAQERLDELQLREPVDTLEPSSMPVLEQISTEVEDEPASVPSAELHFASWGRRLAAFVMDTLLVLIATAAVLTPWAEDVPGQVDAYQLIGAILLLILAPTYAALLEGGRRGQTIGKLLFGIRVRDSRTLEPITHGQAFAREYARFLLVLLSLVLFWIPFLIDHLRPLGHERHQSWHDEAAGTIVVRV